MSVLPDRPSLEHLRKQAKAWCRERAVPLHRAQRDLARDYGFASWPALVRHVRATGLTGMERALVLADHGALADVLRTDPAALTTPIGGLVPLLVLLRHSAAGASDVRRCVELLLDAGADPDSCENYDDWGRSALFEAVERVDLALVRLLLARGATADEDAFYHACEQSDVAYLDALYAPGFENLVNHKLDFEDTDGLRWFLDRGVDVNEQRCLHWAIGRGRGVKTLRMLLDAGADVNLPQGGCSYAEHRPLAVAARCGHIAAYDLLVAHGATAELDDVDAAVLAVARGESVGLPDAPPPLPGIPGDDYGWVLGQFALLGRSDVVRALLDTGLAVDTRGWSNFTPLGQAAMHGRVDVVRLLLERGADVTDIAFEGSDGYGVTPLDCAIWGASNNRAVDGDYPATVALLLAHDAPTSHETPTGDPEIDALLTQS